MAGDGGERVAVDVGAPFPAGGVRVASADVLGLEALEFLLGAEFVGLESRVSQIDQLSFHRHDAKKKRRKLTIVNVLQYAQVG